MHVFTTTTKKKKKGNMVTIVKPQLPQINHVFAALTIV